MSTEPDASSPITGAALLSRRHVVCGGRLGGGLLRKAAQVQVRD